jgi:quercetin dioxygenase-like cupin family protein
MPVISPAPAMKPFPGGTFTPLAAPSRGAERTSVWQVEIEPGPFPDPHSVTVEEVFVVIEGEATVVLGGETLKAATGDAIVVPPDTDFALRNAGDRTLRLVTVLPVGGQVRMADGTMFTPPWAE